MSGKLGFYYLKFSALISLKYGCANTSRGLGLIIGEYTNNLAIKSINNGSILCFWNT